MKNKYVKHFKVLVAVILCIQLLIGCKTEPPNEFIHGDVLVYGEGTGAISAAIQSARGGANTILVSPLPWLGGMMTSAGVSATDGNHQLPSGLWGEFRQRIYDHYGGADSVFTGWVSNTNFEPHIGDQIWKEMATETEQLTILYDYRLEDLQRSDGRWLLSVTKDKIAKTFTGQILIDGTDLGDLLPLAGLDFDVGWDSDVTEPAVKGAGPDYIQDLTYCAILKDYGKSIVVKRPANYSPAEFSCCCKHNCTDPDVHPCETMLSYAKLPNNKFLLNWPINGNDLFVGDKIFNSTDRTSLLDQAKQKTLRYAYYIHDELGYDHLWLADDEFPTPDALPFIAYHREARRAKGLIRFKVSHVMNPFEDHVYRTGIAVGDYPIDHHHDEYPGHSERATFPAVPSYSLPLGVILPSGGHNFLMADKSTSVSHEVNGTTRLQPVIVQTGQAAGALAALAISKNVAPQEVPVRAVQSELLRQNVYLQPYIDVPPDDPDFFAIQRVGSTGLLRGKGIPFQWANQTWFYPDSNMMTQTFIENIVDFFPGFAYSFETNRPVSVSGAFLIAFEITRLFDERFSDNKAGYLQALQSQWAKYSREPFDPFRSITKRELAKLLDIEIRPFQRFDIDHNGVVVGNASMSELDF